MPPAPSGYGPVADEIGDATSLGREATLLALPAVAADTRQRYVDPALQPLRAAAFVTSQSTPDQSEYLTLLTTFGPTESLSDDAQYAATTFTVTTRNANGTQQAQQAFGRGSTVGTPVRTGTLPAATDGTVEIAGDIAVLHCPNPAVERLQILFEGVEVATLDTNTDDLLSAGHPLAALQVAAMLRAAGIDPAKATQHLLQVKRLNSTCMTAFAILDDVLAAVTLDFKNNRCVPNTGESFCLTTIDVATDPTAFALRGLNSRGDVLLFDQRVGGSCTDPAASFLLFKSCAAIWHNGTMTVLPVGFEPWAIAEDGTAAGPEYDASPAGHLRTSVSVLPVGAASTIRLATDKESPSNATELNVYALFESISPGGRVIYSVRHAADGYGDVGTGDCAWYSWGSVCLRNSQFAASGPDWSRPVLMRSDVVPTSDLDCGVYADADAAGFVGYCIRRASPPGSPGSVFTMKDFAPFGSGSLVTAIDQRGTVVVDEYRVVPASTAVGATEQVAQLGYGGDALLRSGGSNASFSGFDLQWRMVNLYSGQATPTFVGALNFSRNGETIRVVPLPSVVTLGQVSGGFGRFVDAKGRLLAQASSSTRASVIGAILTPPGATLPYTAP